MFLPRWLAPLQPFSGCAKMLSLAVLACAAVATPAREIPSQAALVALRELPVEAQNVYRQIHAGEHLGGIKDGAVFANRERFLAPQPRGFYREYTVRTPGAHTRGARRIVCGGLRVPQPDACYYTADHYASFRKIVP